MDNVIYIEDKLTNYGHRTYINASQSDATIAFAVDFNTSREICTKKSTMLADKTYIQVDVCSNIYMNIRQIAQQLKNCRKINITGNGIMTLSKYGIPQEECDQIVYNFLHTLITDYGCKFTEIRSGGQTGFDEAGIICPQQLPLSEVQMEVL